MHFNGDLWRLSPKEDAPKQHVLALLIRISDVLPWDRKSYLTHVILPRLSLEGCTMPALELTHMVVKLRYCYVTFVKVVSQRISNFLTSGSLC